MQSSAREGNLIREIFLIGRRLRDSWFLVANRYRAALAIAGVIMAITSAANISVAMLLGHLVDVISSGRDTKEVMITATWRVLGLLACIYVAREILNVVRRMLVESSCTRLNRDVQLRVVDHVMQLDMQSLGQEKVGALHGKIFRSVDGLIRFVRLMFLDFVPAILTGLFAIITASYKQPWLGVAMLGVIPISIYLTLRQLSNQKGVRLKLMRDCEEIDGTLVEQLAGAEYVRVADTGKAELNRLTDALERRRKREIKHHFSMSLYGCGKALNEGFFHIVVLGAATYMAINGTINYGDVLAFSVLFLNVMSPLNEIHRVVDEGHESSLRIGDLLELLDKPADVSFAEHQKQPKHVGSNLRPILGEPLIEIDNLCAGYVTAGKYKPVLDNVSLSIHHGQTIGVAGRSGSGKSTWIKVLLRLLHPNSGGVKFCGCELEQVTRTQLAENIGYVGQNPFVFAGTIAANIAYGGGERSMEEIVKAARAANIHNEIVAMPEGYNTLVTERGNNLSGGQRQRMAIARLLLNDGPVLILDEATSALDNISERCVQRALGIAAGHRTTILVAHRLTTLKDCDKIFVFEDGAIVESGTYDELVLGSGLFAELVYSAEQGIAEPVS